MDVAEILQEFPKLSPEDLELIQTRLDELRGEEESPEALKAIDEGLWSARMNHRIPLKTFLRKYLRGLQNRRNEKGSLGLADHNPAVAERFVRELKQAVGYLQENPMLGPKVGQRSAVRRVVRGNNLPSSAYYASGTGHETIRLIKCRSVSILLTVVG